MDPENEHGLISSKQKKQAGRCTQFSQKYVISHKTRTKKGWDLMVLLFAIYNSLQIPF